MIRLAILPAVIAAAGCMTAAAGTAQTGPTGGLHYRPQGESVITVDGTHKFNRALYGAHTGFRMECSDYPEFGIYLPRMGGNLRIETGAATCQARYTPGRMDYTLDSGRLTIEAQVLRTSDAALWRITNRSQSPQRVEIRFGGAADKKFHREGDLGVDDPDCFDLKPEYCQGNIYSRNGDTTAIEYGTSERKTLTLVVRTDSSRITELPSFEGEALLAPGEERIVALFPAGSRVHGTDELPALMAQAERERAAVASTVRISTPDPYINPIGGALAVAADGIWSGEAWLHGAIGWRTPHLGWRGAYAGDAIGLHERARTHFDTYAQNQITDIEPLWPHPSQDSLLNLARAEKRFGTQMYSNGYICRRPGHKDEMSHYDMNMVYADALLRHLRHTGDTAYMRRIFPVIARHLAWEKRNFDPDGDALYDAYCCIWASDALYYSAGAVTHSSAYNLFANTLAAQVAQRIGLDPQPYAQEAQAIRRAMESELWMPDKGHWAEYRDFGGGRRLHESAALWTIYHAVDSEVAGPLENYAATRYVDTRIPHIAVRSENPDEKLYTISTTDWKPYSWSINNVAIAEVMHTALAYWQAQRPDEAFALMKAVVMDNMYSGASPLNFGQISQYDAARGECYRDFADPIGVWSRALTEGLFGIRPDLLCKRQVDIVPGFPASWQSASIELPQLAYSFRRQSDRITYRIENRYPPGTPVVLTIPLPEGYATAGVKVNGRKAETEADAESVNRPRIRIYAGSGSTMEVVVTLRRAEAMRPVAGSSRIIGSTQFVMMEGNGLKMWQAHDISATEAPAQRDDSFENIIPRELQPVDMSQCFNARVSDLFRNRYLSPRPPYTTLQIPVQGIGEWCHPTLTADIDDSGLREAAGEEGLLRTGPGLLFRTPREGDNILFTSLWDNYPDSATVPLKGRAARIYLLLAGSTNHMQCNIANAVVRICYADGSMQQTELVNPDNWAPAEQDFYYDDGAFALKPGQKPPYRLSFKTGRMSRTPAADAGITGVEGRYIEGGAGVVIEIKSDPSKELAGLQMETLSNDVVTGLMAITLQKR